MPTEADRMTAIETTLWGRFGGDGISSDVKRHSEQMGELFARDETMRSEMDNRLREFEGRIDKKLEAQNAKLDGLYKMVAGLIISILIGSAGIIVTILVTKGH